MLLCRIYQSFRLRYPKVLSPKVTPYTQIKQKRVCYSLEHSSKSSSPAVLSETLASYTDHHIIGKFEFRQYQGTSEKASILVTHVSETW